VSINTNRLNDIEVLAEYIADTYFPSSRVEPESIAGKVGISYCYGRYEDAFDGMLECDDGDFHIYGNLDRVKYPEHARARFTFSHELGHYFLDEHRNAIAGIAGSHASFADYQSNNPVEQEADAFAAALLMPKKRFNKAARRRRPSVRTIRELVEQFGTSYASTAIRYARSNTNSVSVMRWTSDERKWCWSSDDMQNITKQNKMFKQTSDVPKNSLTHELLRSKTPSCESRGTTLSAWCPYVYSGSASDKIMIEEAMSLGEYGVMTLLYPADK